MTIITRLIYENVKKIAKQHQVPSKQEPLMKGNGLHSSPTLENLENGALVVTMARARRINHLTTVCVFLTALLVLSTGIIGGVYLYRQFAQYRLRHFRGWCSIPFQEELDEGDRFESQALTGNDNNRHRVFSALKHEQAAPNFENFVNDLAAQMKRTIDDELLSQDIESGNQIRPFNSFFDEEFDIDIEFEQYERIEVPDFSHGRRGRFIHDFAENKTGIIDIEEGRCFVLPLNRTMVIPPKSLFDLVSKMRSGYYDIDTEVVREMYRVVTPPITNYKSLGYYIARECANLPTYRLERIISPVYKRSISNDPHHSNVVFSEFAGNKIAEIHIVNLHSAKGSRRN